METLKSVVIVGGGPAGLFTALKLGRAGIPVTVLEADGCVMRSPRAVAYHWPTIQSLERLGILDDALKQGVKVHEIANRRLDGSPQAVLDHNVLNGDIPYNYMLVLGQNSLAEILVKHIQKLANVEIRWGHRVTTVKRDNDGVVLTYANDAGEAKLRAPWVIATDGARSTVRESLGITFDGMTWPERFVAVNVFYDFFLHGYSRGNFIVDPVDWAVIVQIDQTGLWRVCYGEDANLTEQEVRARLPERFKRILPGSPDPASYRVELCTPYRVHQRAASTFRQGRVLLAGDAAHATNPLGGLGLSSGIIDAEQLALALTKVIKGEADEVILDHYAEDRRRVFLEKTSPMAIENKRRVTEADPKRRAEDEAIMAQVHLSPDIQRAALMEISAITGDWIGRSE